MTDNAVSPLPAHPRLLVLGANGPTGKQVVRQALERGYRVLASTRNPQAFPEHDDRVRLVVGDASDPHVLDDAVAASDVVICTIGTRFTAGPVDVYAASAKALVAAMRHHGRRRIIVVTSGGVAPSHQRRGLLQRASFTLMRRLVGRTVYDDMEAMESVIAASGLVWTIVRPPGLVDEPGRGYVAAPGDVDGALCAREDLAAMLLDQLDDPRSMQAVMGVATPGMQVSAGYMIRHEVLKR